MSILELNSVRAEDERILASFTSRLIEIAANAGTPPTATLDAMRQAAIALDRRGFVVGTNAAAETVFDNEIKIEDRRLFVRDPDARALLKEAIGRLKTPARLNCIS